VLARLSPDRAAHGDAAVRIAMDPVELAAAEWACPFDFIAATPHALNRFACAVAVADVAAERAAAGLPPLERANGLRAVTDAATLLHGAGAGAGAERGGPPSLGIAQEDWLSAAALRTPVRVYRAAAAPRINSAAAVAAAGAAAEGAAGAPPRGAARAPPA